MPEPCELCAVEALLRVKTYYLEAMKRSGSEFKEKLREMVRETLHAEDHLAEKYPQLSNEIRAWRKSWQFSQSAEALPRDLAQTLESKIDLLDRACPSCTLTVSPFVAVTQSTPEIARRNPFNISSKEDTRGERHVVSSAMVASIYGFEFVGKGVERLGVYIDQVTGRAGRPPHERWSTAINVAGGLAIPLFLYWRRAAESALNVGLVALGGHLLTKVLDYAEEYSKPAGFFTPAFAGRGVIVSGAQAPSAPGRFL
jgi:hypothetical protein